MSHKASDVATNLGERIVVRSDFIKLVDTLEDSVAREILAHQKSNHHLDSLLAPGMRFADILSHSSEENHRNLSYRIVALFQELKDQGQLSGETIQSLDAFSSAILAALGNFPGLRKLEESVDKLQYVLPADREVSRLVKESIQRTADGKYTLTDAQHAIATDLRNFNFYSFSGPTSLGKSFVIKNFIKSEVSQESFRDKCVVFVVPTYALVSQTARDLRRDLGGVMGVNVAIHPDQPQLMLNRFRASIYVFTPERLIRYLNTQGREVELLVVDEAHRIVSAKDSRSPLFYYAIDQTLRKYASKLIFSSPSLENPGLFLELFGKSPAGSVVVYERTVTQQRFFIDFARKEASYFPSITSADRVPVSVTDGFKPTLWGSIKYWANQTKSLIYVNTPGKVVKFALSFAPAKSVKLNHRTRNLINKIREEIHPEYYLVDALEHGVAFHHGRMPVSIREEIEAVFKDPKSGVDFLVCTSTLLEGVNLPARNIFVLTDKHGNGREFKKLDFENLVGRAGRLTKDFKGNVFCIRAKSGQWENPEIINPIAKPEKVSSFLIEPKKSKKRHFTDIEKILLEKPLPKSRSVSEIESAERYAAVLTVQILSNNPSLLTEKFNARAQDGAGTLKKVRQAMEVNVDTLKRSPEFDPRLQERVRRELTRLEEPIAIHSTSEIQFETVLTVLTELSRLYKWKERESRGRRPMFLPKSSDESHARQLRYWAQLTLRWMTGSPMNLIIQSSIKHHKSVGDIYVADNRTPDGKYQKRYEDFDPDSKDHVNLVIERTMTDIEYGVGFRVLSYLKNYYDLCIQVFGREKSGLDLSILIEFGTSDPTVIELQQVGYSRDVSNELQNRGRIYLELNEDGSVNQINTEGILADHHLSDIAKQETKDLFTT